MAISDMQVNEPTDNDFAGLGAEQLRGIKSDTQVCFPAVDGVINNVGAAQTGGDTDPPDAATFTALFAAVKTLQGGVGSGFVGELKWYYGDAANIPAGWYIANGTNGTIDMTGRFLIAADNGTGLPTYAGNPTGGALGSGGVTDLAGGHNHTLGAVNDHQLAIGNLPEHFHYLFGAEANTSAGSNVISASDAASADVSNTTDNNKPYQISPVPTDPGGTDPGVGRSSETGSDPTTAITHSGNVDNEADHQHGLGASSLPPWQAAYLIMFTGV